MLGTLSYKRKVREESKKEKGGGGKEFGSAIAASV